MRKYKINFNINYQQWSDYFLLVNKPNLPQSWHYGDAKKISQGWVVVRGIITEYEKPIALIQVCYKKILFFKLVRISYGPLWVIEKPSSEQIKGVFYVIKENWCLKKLCILSIAPNLENSLENNKILSSLSFYKRKCMPYESGLIDLTQPKEILRSKLRSNWRGHLTASEKKGFLFHASKNYSDFQWLISCFEKLRKEKNFYGHSVELLNTLHYKSFDRHDTWVTTVTQENEKLGGMLISYSGSSCTSLITYIHNKSRMHHAGNFLLWNSVLHAKNQGCLWFDLGSTTDNKFKTGLPHISFQLIGEYYVFI